MSIAIILPAPLRRLALTAIASVVLSACGGGDAATAPPPELPGAAIATALTSAPQSYPAALAVFATPDAISVDVKGVQRTGGSALGRDAYFPMGSLTKAMTATLAGVLVQDGKLRWDTRIADVLPEIFGTALAQYREVTLLDLLAHRAGVFPATTAEQIARLPAFDGSPAEQRLQLAVWALEQRPVAVPGKEVAYSNGGYLVAAAMIERVAGQPYEALLQARVFAPLGTTVRFDATATGDPWGHADTGARHWEPVDPSSPEAALPVAANPAGGARLQGAGLGRFLQMHLRAAAGRRGELLTPETARVLHTVVQQDVALGWMRGSDAAGRALDWHDGSDDASYFALMAVGRASPVAGAVVVTGYAAQTPQEVSAALARMFQ